MKSKFRPNNPHKYKGDPTNIIYRSSWELKLMAYLDRHDDIIQWNSEEVVIPYRSPIDNRIHRYFVDFWVRKKSVDGSTQTLLIEVKPLKEVTPPKRQKNTRSRKYLHEVKTWGINQAKWNAAKEFCKDRKWTFVIMTEKELGIKY